MAWTKRSWNGESTATSCSRAYCPPTWSTGCVTPAEKEKGMMRIIEKVGVEKRRGARYGLA